MPNITVTVDFPEETAEKVAALSEERRVQITRTALQNAARFAVRPGANKAEQTAALFAQWAAEDKAAGITPEDAEKEWEQLKANLNENRRLTGEEPLF